MHGPDVAGGGKEDMGPTPLVALDLVADATAPREARRAIGPAAAQVGADAAGITLAVSEAVTNAVTHGYRERPAGRVRVRAECRERTVVVTVEDDGDGAPHGDPQRGIGIATMEHLADECAIEGDARGTRVTMRFPAQPAWQRR